MLMKRARMAIPLAERTKEAGRGTAATVTGAKPSPALSAWVIVNPISVSPDRTWLIAELSDEFIPGGIVAPGGIVVSRCFPE